MAEYKYLIYNFKFNLYSFCSLQNLAIIISNLNYLIFYKFIKKINLFNNLIIPCQQKNNFNYYGKYFLSVSVLLQKNFQYLISMTKL